MRQKIRTAKRCGLSPTNTDGSKLIATRLWATGQSQNKATSAQTSTSHQDVNRIRHFKRTPRGKSERRTPTMVWGLRRESGRETEMRAGTGTKDATHGGWFPTRRGGGWSSWVVWRTSSANCHVVTPSAASFTTARRAKGVERLLPASWTLGQLKSRICMLKSVCCLHRLILNFGCKLGN